MVLPYTEVVAGASTNVNTPTTEQINQGNDQLTPYDSAKNNGYYRQISQGVANLSAEIINVIEAAGLTPDTTSAQLIEAINLLVPDAASLPEAIAGTNNTKFLTPYLASNLPAFRAANQTPQTLTHLVATKITGFTVDYDIGGYWNAATSRYIPPAGKYKVNVVANGICANDYSIVWGVYLNGTPTVYPSILGYAKAGTVTKLPSVATITLNGTDYLEVYVTMGYSSPATLTLNEVFLEIEKIR